jgi:hypothetical protein
MEATPATETSMDCEPIRYEQVNRCNDWLRHREVAERELVIPAKSPLAQSRRIQQDIIKKKEGGYGAGQEPLVNEPTASVKRWEFLV